MSLMNALLDIELLLFGNMNALQLISQYVESLVLLFKCLH